MSDHMGSPAGLPAGDSVNIPEPLRPYMGGKEVLVPKQ